MTKPLIGILTGISYVSGLDYYESINRLVTANVDDIMVAGDIFSEAG